MTSMVGLTSLYTYECSHQTFGCAVASRALTLRSCGAAIVFCTSSPCIVASRPFNKDSEDLWWSGAVIGGYALVPTPNALYPGASDEHATSPQHTLYIKRSRVQHKRRDTSGNTAVHSS